MPLTVLSIDDSSDDTTLLRLGCAAARVCFRVQSVDTGDAAIAYLEGRGRFADREQFPLPNLVLLDLKMPGKSGFEVLSWIRSQASFKTLPVVVFTSSIHPEDRARSLALGASEFVVKPVSFDGLQSLVLAIDQMLGSGAKLNPGALQRAVVQPATSL